LAEIALRATHLVKTVQDQEIIKDGSITVNSETVYAFLGANGAGKTTVFKMLAGLMTPTNGKIEVFGLEMSLNRSEIVKNIGSIIEIPYFYEHLSAAENLEIHLAYMGLENDIARVGWSLDIVGLNISNKQPVSKYSLGMRQRLGIARALVHDPKLLILDEPINGLDPSGIREMRDLFARITKQEKKTILISSHILSEVELLADTVGIITNGRILDEQPMDTIRLNYPKGLEEHYFNIVEGGRISV
jgi:ABC-2 type transport system ATP-binding protein